MTKAFKLFWQLLIFPLLYTPYSLINKNFLVEWLGCGCPRVDESGNLVANRFSANSFTALFWGLIALIVIIISVYNIKLIEKWYFKSLYIIFMIAASVLTALTFFYSMQWN